MDVPDWLDFFDDGYSFLPDYGESEKVIVWQSIYVYTFHFSASVLKQFYWMRLQYISTTGAGDIRLNKFKKNVLT